MHRIYLVFLYYHLRCSRNHVFDKVRMTRTVRMSVVSFLGGVFHVSYVYCDASCLFFWGFINGIIRHELC